MSEVFSFGEEVQQEAQEAQNRMNEMLPEDLEDYTGQWVAIRDGRVVIASEKAEEVFNSPDVEETDLLYLVPPPGPHFYQFEQVA